MTAINLRYRLFVLLLLRMRLRRKRKNKYLKSKWVRKIFRDRDKKSEYYTLVQDLKLFDHNFFRCFRMSPSKFETLLSWVAPYIIKSSLRTPTASPAERLCVTLRYFCTGDAQMTIATSYCISPSVVGRIINHTSKVIWDVLSEKEYLKAPQGEKCWKRISSEFEYKWNFPHCMGAIDGKHVIIQAPPRCGSEYFNYKKTHSIVLLAVCNANYQSTLVDVGDNGRQSDGGVYINSKLGYAIDNNLLSFPKPGTISNYGEKLYPYVFVADDAFSLKPYMIKPYPGSSGSDKTKIIFNYHLSRARRVIEKCFWCSDNKI